jgi:hypothetical protein
MYPVVIHDVNASAAIDMKNMLLADGLCMDQDFTWHYQQARWDDFSHEPTQPKCVKFNFAKESLAVFYRLKWS